MQVSYDLRKRMARKTAIEANEEILKNQGEFFKGVNAAIVCYMILNETTYQYDVYCEWVGGETASISGEIVSLNMPRKPAVGDKFELEGLEVVLEEYSPLGDFWYVRQNHESA